MHSSQYPNPPGRPADGPDPAPGSLQELIVRARQLREGVDTVRRSEPEEGSGPQRPRRATWDLAVLQLEDVRAHLQLLAPPGEVAAADADPGTGGGGRIGSAEWSLLTDGVVWTEEMFALFGRSPADGPLTLDELPSCLVPEDQPALTAAVTGCLIDARTVQCEFRVVMPDGSRHTLQLVGEPVLDASGGTVAMWALVRDVTELRDAPVAADGPGADQAAVLGRPRRPGAARTPHTAGPPRTSETVWRDAPERSAHPDVPGSLELAAAYLPAVHGAPAEGKWHDWLELPDGSSLLSVGDLSGQGSTAAANTAATVGALRGISLAGASPARVLGHLNELLDCGSHPALASLVLCRYRPWETTLTWAQAGHPAPLLCRGGSGRILPRPAGTLLGAVGGESGYEERTDRLRKGDTLVLQTDGLFPSAADGPAGSGGRGTDPRLLTLAGALCAAPSAQDALRVVMRACEDGDRPEDVCLLVARVS